MVPSLQDYPQKKTNMRGGAIAGDGVGHCWSWDWNWDFVQEIDPEQSFSPQHSQFVDRLGMNPDPMWLASAF